MSDAAQTEPVDQRRKRLYMRSIRRGIKEMDLILTAYADANLAQMSKDGLDLYDRFLSENDHDLYAWINGQSTPPEVYADLVDDVRNVLEKAGGVAI